MEEYIVKKKNIYHKLLDFIEGDENSDVSSDENYQELLNIIDKEKICKNQSEFKDLLFLISKISKNHRRRSDFIEKINKFFLHFEKQIKQTFSNLELFNIFKSDKLLLLFLYEHKFITSNEYIVDSIMSKSDKNFDTFFYPEIQSQLSQVDKSSIECKIGPINYTDDKFNENRHKGQNESYICTMIRQDSVEEFISYATKNNLSLSNSISPSLFESNSILEGQNLTLIEYAAFYGSIQIFQYLLNNHVDLSESLWIYSIHSQNPELIHILEQNDVLPSDRTYIECLIESIKCHHNDFARYFEENLIEQENLAENIEKIQIAALRYCNYSYFPDKIDGSLMFYYLHFYDYTKLVDFILEKKKDEFEEKIIFFLFRLIKQFFIMYLNCISYMCLNNDIS